jgi:hypothetical protein
MFKNKIILIGLVSLTTACSIYPKRKRFIPRSIKLDRCIQKYIMLELKSESAIKICKTIYADKKE